MSISFCSHNHLCKHVCNYFQYITLLKVNTHQTINELKHRDLHISPFYEHKFTNTLVVKRTYKKLYKSITLDETFLSYLGVINTNDLIYILDTNDIKNYEPKLIR